MAKDKDKPTGGSSGSKGSKSTGGSSVVMCPSGCGEPLTQCACDVRR